MKLFLWRVCAFVLLALAASGNPVLAAPEKVDPLVGNWLYYKNNEVAFKADGTADWHGKLTGTWEYLHNPEVQRHYRIVWNHGKSIDNLTLSEDGQRGHVTNQTGHGTQYDVRRAVPDNPVATAAPATPAPTAATPSVSAPADAADPVVGDWLWSRGRPVTFKPDGTLVSSKNPQRGTWEYLRNPEAERKYRVTWVGGKAVDTLSFTRDAPTGHVTNDHGGQYDVRRATADESAHYFGVPNP